MLVIFTKRYFMLDVWKGSECTTAYAIFYLTHLSPGSYSRKRFSTGRKIGTEKISCLFSVNLKMFWRPFELPHHIVIEMGYERTTKILLEMLKGAAKLYFMYYSCVVIILFNMGLYKSAFSTYYFVRTRFSSFCVLVFRISVFLAFNF